MPLLIIDSKKTITDRNSFNARGAGILGFSIFGKNITYALDDNMNLNLEKVTGFFKKNNYKVMIFGFTSIIWSNFILKLEEKKIEVLVENKLKNQNSYFGRTRKMTPVIFESTLCNPGDMIQVEIISSNQNNLFGKHMENKFKAA